MGQPHIFCLLVRLKMGDHFFPSEVVGTMRVFSQRVHLKGKRSEITIPFSSNLLLLGLGLGKVFVA